MLSIDIQYLNLIPLIGFTRIDDHKWNFRCPVCGDSKKKQTLKRGNAQIWNGSLFIKCFNCSYSKPFSFFIRTQFPEHYTNYRLDILRSRNVTQGTSNFKKDSNQIIKREYTKIDLPSISSLPSDHIAVKTVHQRLIPKEYHTSLYYTDNFALWVNSIIPDKCKHIRLSEKRLVIPFFDRFNQLIGVQGRSLEDQTPKYLTIKLNDANDLLFGMDLLDDTKKIYVTEGPIDSMFLDNAIATCTSISRFDILQSIAPVTQFILVYDNEKRNSSTVKFMTKALELGFKIVIWHKDIMEKDLNDMILKNNYTKADLYDIIDENCYTGKTGLIRLKFWRK
jgi:hypothetical protein